MRQGAKVIVPIAIVALVASLVIRPPSADPTATPSATDAAQASLAPRPSATGPSPTTEPWQELVLDPAVVAASLSPEKASPNGVATTSRFSLRSLNGSPAAALADGVRAEPPIEFRVVKGATVDEAFLEPVKPLLESTTYRVTLEAQDGALAGSWAFRTERPVRIVGTLPGDESTGVPIDTGIEITFDQDGTTGLETRFHIEPRVAGSFEQHGRTWSFVPSARLELATAYRVTIDPGVGVTGSERTMAAGLSFRFETHAAVTKPEWRLSFGGPMAAIKPGEKPTLPLSGWVDDDEFEDPIESPTEVGVEIFRLPSLAKTLAAATTITGPDSWLVVSRGGLVDTAGLVRVAKLDAPIVVGDEYGSLILQIPVRLDAGAYVVVVPRQGRSAQLLLQVGTLATYAVSSETDAVAWVNDLTSVGPVPGATIKLADGTALGTTNAQGIARFVTSEPLLPSPSEGHEARPSIISITAPDGRWLVAGLGSPVSWIDGRYDNEPSSATNSWNRWWLLFNTDRVQYRQTDVIHAWGLVRARDGGTVPPEAELRLRPGGDESEAAIERVVVHPNAQGVFAADVPIRKLPRAGYSLELVVAGDVVESRWIQVTEIRKPSYQVTVATERHAYLDGGTIEVNIQVSFFDGSTVPQMELRVDSDPGGFNATVKTNAAGSAHVSLPAVFDGPRSGWNGQSISVTPARPEEGEIAGRADVIVFPSAAWISSTSSLDGKALVVTGDLASVDFATLNRTYLAESWSWPRREDVPGEPISGRTVSVKVVEQREVRSEDGSHYDYLEKRVVTTYTYKIVETTVGTYRASTGADGTFRIEVTVPSDVHSYELTVSSTDAAGRSIRIGDQASPPIDPGNQQRPPYLLPEGCGPTSITVGLDAEASVTLHDGDGSAADDGRFLFLVGNRGIRQATVSTSSTFHRTLRLDDLPRFTIRAVQFTAQGYAVADADVEVDTEDLAIDVQLTPDRARYGPGDRVTVQIRTLGPDGLPVNADVVVQGVDEKLFAIGAASESDVLAELHRWTSPGFLQSFTSHRIPVRPNDGGCGDEGGSRESFGDVVTAQLVHTGPDGRATVSFDLLDDLTSWHLTALALSGGVRAGSSSVLIPVGLPFFVETVLAPEYLVGDVPVLRVRGYGDALEAGDRVRFTISAPSLGIEEATITGEAFDAVRFPLPALVAGNHRIRVEATGPGSGHKDAIVRTIHVVPSRLATLVTQYDLLTPGYVPVGGEGLTTYTILDAGRGSLIGGLLDLASTYSARFDSTAAAEMARRMLIDEFDFPDSDLEPTGFDAARYQQDGIALLPYASRDPELTALAALIVPDLINVDDARGYLREYANSAEASIEARAMVLAGLAGLGDDVLEDLRALVGAPGSIRASLWLAIGLAAVGDENGARAIERELLAVHGQRFGPWVRLEVGTSIDDTDDAARLLLVLSSRLGEPFARDVERYLADHPTLEHALALERLAYTRASLDRLPHGAGRVAWSVDGDRHVVELEPGGATTLVLTAAQRGTLVLEPLAGNLAVVTSWTGLGADVPSGGPVTISRVVTPASDAPDDRLVRVHIHVTFEPLATRGCWQITDLAPSGLVPIERRSDWPDADIASGIEAPYLIDAQRVSWCASTEWDDRDFEYVARVVSPGTYRWEPAIIQSVEAPEVGAATSEFTFTIR